MGAPVYDLGKRFPPGAIAVTSPAWIIAVERLPLPLSFSRREMRSNTRDPADGVRSNQDRPTLIVREDCVALQINGAKESHLKQLAATILPGKTNYLNEILPGDWVCAWIVNSSEKADDLVGRIRKGEACNGWTDGLKFVGRASAARANVTWGADGRRESTVTLQAVGFREMDSMLFYDHALAEAAITQDQIGQWLYKLGIDIRDLFEAGATAGEPLADNVHKLVPSLIDIVVGRGADASINPTGETALAASPQVGPQTQRQAEVSAGVVEAPYAYLVPVKVGAWLGKRSRSPSKEGGVLSYADLLELVVGVQAYSGGGSTDPGTLFAPDLDDSSTVSRRYTGKPLLGSYLPVMPPLLNTPLWQLLKQFLNEPVNEMFMALRVNKEGAVVPTLTVRQIPFTTTGFDSNPTGPANYTKFLDLPRWKISDSMPASFSPGRSDVTRTNFVHVFGQSGYAAGLGVTEQLVQNQPVRDDVDIERSGLRMYQNVVACGIGSTAGKTPRAWMELISDWMIGSQWTLSGALELRVGIDLPICEGDNLEIEDSVYHIEQVSHVCFQSPTGANSFVTSLQLSNGTRSDSAVEIDGADPAYPLYPGASKDDLAVLTVGQTSTEAPPSSGAPLMPPQVSGG